MPSMLLLCWTLLCSFRGITGSHPGVTRVLPVEGGLSDFRVGQPTGHQVPSPPQASPQAPSALTPSTVVPALSVAPAPAPVREDAPIPESGVRFPNSLDTDHGNLHVRGSPYPVWSNNLQGYIPRTPPDNMGMGGRCRWFKSCYARHGIPAQGFQPSAPVIDNSVSASGIAPTNYRQVGEYIQEDSDHADVTYRDEHSPSIVIKGPHFNSVAIGFIVYLILLTVLQNSMLNWSQKGALLTLGPTTQRLQREAVDRASSVASAPPPLAALDIPAGRTPRPLPLPSSNPQTTVPPRDVDSRARTDPELEVDDREQDPERGLTPISVAAVLNEDVAEESRRMDNAKPQIVGPRAFKQIMS